MSFTKDIARVWKLTGMFTVALVKELAPKVVNKRRVLSAVEEDRP